MSTVAVIDGARLAGALDLQYERSHPGLEHHAFHRWHTSLLLTRWGHEHITHLGLFEGDRLLASATRYTLTGYIDAAPVPVCGIGNVHSLATNGSPEPGLELLDQLLRTAGADGSEAALLFGHASADWCERNAFHSIAQPEMDLTLPPTPQPGAPMTLVRGGEERDLQAIAAMGRKRAAPFRFALERDSDFVNHAVVTKRLLAGLGPSGNQELQFFIAEEGITAAAYVVMTVLGSTWTLEECGDRDPDGARVGALLQALIARDPTVRPPTIRGWLPHGFCPPQARAEPRAAAGNSVMFAFLGARAGAAPLVASDALYWHGDLF